jgi:bifunctional NMN adenylyltransferase/nudix hydrolase
MNKKYDIIVFIGRFQPVHNAHLEIIKKASEIAEKVVLIVGSAFQPRTYKNPFTEHDRIVMVDMVCTENNIRKNVCIDYISDSIYNDQAWAIKVQQIVDGYITKSNPKIGIIGHDKDESTFYLSMFPQWERVHVDLIESLHSTDIRDLYFRKDANMNFIKGVVPSSIFKFLEHFKTEEEYNQIIKEREFIKTYKKQYECLPYPPVFVTTDTIVVQSGHVLMIKRKSEPGKGLWALPGGFLDANKDKSMVSCAIRELKEETGIKVPIPVLLGSIKSNKVFDAINRSARGRTITHAYYIQLPDGELPKVKGQDDAEKASWIPIARLDSSEVFEDHYEIISNFVGA